MPDVTITNPPVQIDLAQGSSTTVPAGEQWKVSLLQRPSEGFVGVNGTFFFEGNNRETVSHVRVDLFGGDTVDANGKPALIRGYRVD
jgi:hypothetical protein